VDERDRRLYSGRTAVFFHFNNRSFSDFVGMDKQTRVAYFRDDQGRIYPGRRFQRTYRNKTRARVI